MNFQMHRMSSTVIFSGKVDKLWQEWNKQRLKTLVFESNQRKKLADYNESLENAVEALCGDESDAAEVVKQLLRYHKPLSTPLVTSLKSYRNIRCYKEIKISPQRKCENFFSSQSFLD